VLIVSLNGLRLLLDTNTAISGLIWQGSPGKLIKEAVAGRIQLISTEVLFDELWEVLQRPKFKENMLRLSVTDEELFEGYTALVQLVEPVDLKDSVSRDPDDDHILAAAIGGQADMIVSGDDDLLALRNYRGITIISARNAIYCLPQ
jgi:putative PIN family toxin of toxin-antitoxin system